MTHDVIVVGVGGMGSAAVWHLARRGLRVLGLERFDIPHAMGSSHGVSRIIRLPYYEHPAYVPLLHRAYALWREIEAASGAQLLVTTGSIDAGPEDGALFQGALASARLHGLAARGADRRRGQRALPRLPASRQDARGLPAGGRLIASERASSPMSRRRRRRAPTSTPASGCWAGRRGPAARAWQSRPTGAATRRRGSCSPPAPGWRIFAGPLAGARRARAAGAGLAAAAPARAVRPGPFPGLQPAGRGGPLLRPSRRPRCPASSSAATIISDETGPAETIAPRRRTRRTRRILRAVRRALLPGGRRPDDGAAKLPVHQHAGRALHPRPPPGRSRRSCWRRPAPATASSSAAWSARSWPTLPAAADDPARYRLSVAEPTGAPRLIELS